MINRIVYTSFLLGASFASTEAQVSTPPNIVLILCDDMGFSDLGCKKHPHHCRGDESEWLQHIYER